MIMFRLDLDKLGDGQPYFSYPLEKETLICFTQKLVAFKKE